MEKWKSGFTDEMIELVRPQGVWKSLWKTLSLWKKKQRNEFSTLSTGNFFNNLWKSGKLCLIIDYKTDNQFDFPTDLWIKFHGTFLFVAN